MSGLLAKSDPIVVEIYEALLEAVRKFGSVRAEEKRTSIHLMAKTAFAGVHPRKTGILLNIRSANPIKNKRVRKCEQVSTNRFHNEVLIGSPAEFDRELIGWLKAAHALSGG